MFELNGPSFGFTVNTWGKALPNKTLLATACCGKRAKRGPAPNCITVLAEIATDGYAEMAQMSPLAAAKYISAADVRVEPQAVLADRQRQPFKPGHVGVQLSRALGAMGLLIGGRRGDAGSRCALADATGKELRRAL